MKKQFSLGKKGLLLALLIALGVGAWYVTRCSEGIYDYTASTDKTWILDQFKKHWYWLISDYSPDYDPSYMLDEHAPSKEERYKGSLIIKTYRIQCKTVGFIAYYPMELYEGRILFLEVDENYRRKGIARKLLSYAIDDLKKRGYPVVRLMTRADNAGAVKLYKSYGFKETWNDGAYVKFEKVIA